MLSLDKAINDPNDQSLVYTIQIGFLGVCLVCLYFYAMIPYKLNRSDYDFGRRETMIPGGAPRKQGGYSAAINGEANASSLNQMLNPRDEDLDRE